MFEGRFFELALLFVITLMVLGPKRMPGLVRTVGRWVGKARAMARDFQQQLENEVQLDELKRITEAQIRQEPAAAPAPSPEINPPAAAAATAGSATTAPEAAQPAAETPPTDSTSTTGAADGITTPHAEQKDHAAA